MSTAPQLTEARPGVFLCPTGTLLVCEGSPEAAVAAWSPATVALAAEYAARNSRTEATR